MTTHRPQRKSPRLKGYDYSQSGAYFVTICCHQRMHLFGRIADGAMILNQTGEMALGCWLNIPDHFPSVDLDAVVIMPNHMHGILVLTDTVGTRYCASAPRASAPCASAPCASETCVSAPCASETCASAPRASDKPPTLGRVINAYKGAVTRQCRRLPNADPHARIWQGRYHDHIIRDEADLNRIRAYMINNPSLWESDTFYDA